MSHGAVSTAEVASTFPLTRVVSMVDATLSSHSFGVETKPKIAG